MLAEGIILSAVLHSLSQLLIGRAVPGILQGRLRQIAHIRHLKVVAAADSQLAAWRDPHIRVRHQAGFLNDLLRGRLVRRASGPVGQNLLQIAHLDQDVHILELVRMAFHIFIDLLDVVMELHVQAVIVDDELIHIRDDGLHLVHGQKQAVGGHEDEHIRELLPRILVKLHDPGIQPGFVVSIQSQMALIAPVAQLINDAVVQLVRHPGIGTLFRVLVRGAEFTGAVAAVDRLQVHHIGVRDRIALHEIFDIFSLRFSSRQKLQGQISLARQLREIFSHVPAEFSGVVVNSDRHVTISFILCFSARTALYALSS